jgi:polar amino acid transport system permease protein
MIRSFGWNELLFLIEAARWTVALTLIALIGGGLVGFGVALLRVARSKPNRTAALVYIQAVQGTPVLMLLFLSYYGLSLAGLELPPLVAAGLSMSLYASAYLAEIWRGAIQSVPRPQWEASACLALTTWQQYRYVVLPQAARISLPPTVGFLVQLVKNTSIASIIGFVELARAGQLINNATFEPFKVFLTVAAIYFVICFPLSQLSRRLERRLHVAGAR